MRFLAYTSKVLNLAKVIFSWAGELGDIDHARRLKTAGYCDQVAESLARAGDAFTSFAQVAGGTSTRNGVRRDVRREMGRLAGYVEDIAALLDGHLDGRKIAGVKRRLDGLIGGQTLNDVLDEARSTGRMPDIMQRVGRLAEAEGYFRSLADRLRT